MRADESAAVRGTQGGVQRRGGAVARQRCCSEAHAEARRPRPRSTSSWPTRYAANELRINALNDELRDKATALGLAEVFGLARQVANDASTILQQSLITTQFPPAGQKPRDEFLREFSAARSTPTRAELERLWFEIQREMTASGQVALPGQSRAAERRVGRRRGVRIGPFTATGGRPVSGVPAELAHAERAAAATAAEFMDDRGSFHERDERATRKRSWTRHRGVLARTCTSSARAHGAHRARRAVGYVIIVVGVLGSLAFFYQLFHLILVRHGRAPAAQESRPARRRTTRSAACCSRSRATRTGSKRTPRSPSCASPRPCCAKCRSSSASRRSCDCRRGRSAARPDRHRHRHDHHVPEHHRVRLERSEADGHTVSARR